MAAHQSSSFLLWSSRLCFTIHVVVCLLKASLISAKTESSGSLSVTPNLPFGDINVVILTDVHSWVGSHRHQEPYYDADFGDVLSFWERLKDYCDEQASSTVSIGANPNRIRKENSNPECHDIFFVNNGDFVDGTGLSQTIDGDNNPAYLIPLLEKMPYDAVNVGNHELYSKKNIEFMTRPGGYVDWWGDRYLTSNINKVDIDMEEEPLGTNIAKGDAKDPLGSRYKILYGNNSKLLVFGFLYNMRDYARGAGIEIERVQTTVTQPWFLDALEEEQYDAILVLAHMDLVDPIVNVIRSGIRDQVGDDIPVVFVTGHTHYRGVKQLDDLTMTFEAGRYLDTVGFVSLPKKDSVSSTSNASSLFGHTFLDTNRRVLFQDTLGFSRVEDGQTKDGKDLSEFIDHTRKKMGLEREIGCAPHSYYVNRHIDAPDSLWGLYRDEVIPKIFPVHQAMITTKEKHTKADDDLPIAMLLSKQSWRYDLYSNASLVVDDVVSVAPFNDSVVHLGTFSSKAILEANRTLNSHRGGDHLWSSHVLPSFILIGDLEEPSFAHISDSGSTPLAETKYHLYTHEFNAATLQSVLKKIAPSETIEIKKTELTSTMIWLAFIEKYWSCDGTLGMLPNWFPEYKNAVPKLKDEYGKLDRKMIMLLIAILMVVGGFFFKTMTLVWRGYLTYHPVMVADDDSVSIEDGFYKMEGDFETTSFA